MKQRWIPLTTSAVIVVLVLVMLITSINDVMGQPPDKIVSPATKITDRGNQIQLWIPRFANRHSR